MSPLRAGMAGRLGPALFGIASRRAAMAYFRIVLLILLILIATAWTIDLAKFSDEIRTDAAQQGVSTLSIMAPYLAYRTADMVTRLLPMACFFGVFLAEILRRSQLETVILRAAGATPARLLSGVLLFAIPTGFVQMRLEQSWRPAAVMAQVELGHGDYAERFRHQWTDKHSWFVSGDAAIRAQVWRGDPPIMRDLLIFKGVRSPRLTMILSAERAAPAGAPDAWRLQGVARWNTEEGMAGSTPVGDMTMTLDLIPQELTFLEVPPNYIPAEALRRLATIPPLRRDPGVDVAQWRRWTAWLLPGSFALLAFSFASLGYSGRRAIYPRMIALATVGYLSVVSVKVFWAFGELALVAAPVAVLASVICAVAISLVALTGQAGRLPRRRNPRPGGDSSPPDGRPGTG